MRNNTLLPLQEQDAFGGRRIAPLRKAPDNKAQNISRIALKFEVVQVALRGADVRLHVFNLTMIIAITEKISAMALIAAASHAVTLALSVAAHNNATSSLMSCFVTPRSLTSLMISSKNVFCSFGSLMAVSSIREK